MCDNYIGVSRWLPLPGRVFVSLSIITQFYTSSTSKLRLNLDTWIHEYIWTYNMRDIQLQQVVSLVYLPVYDNLFAPTVTVH